jgi:chemotaxis protein histidine kinase CheA/ActR/RegA family two-component response regulator
MTVSSTSRGLANPLETLAQEWQSAAMARTTRLVSIPDLDSMRQRLSALADAALACDRPIEGQALRRVAILTEVWECLWSEPGHDEAAGDLASFCLRAITLLADDRPAESSDPLGNAASLLRESDERWSDYLALVDPTRGTGELAGESTSCDQEFLPEEAEEPPAIDAQTLVRLITGSDGAGAERVRPRSVDEPRSSSRSPEELSATRETLNGADPPEPAIASAPRSGQNHKNLNPTARQKDPQIPPLPTQFDLDAEVREAFLADATELFERIENLVVGLAQNSDHRAAIHELARCFHTLKGAAGSVGVSELAALIHQTEERLEQAGGRVSDGLNDLLHRVVGYLDEMIGLLRRGKGAADSTADQAPPSDHGTAPVLLPVAPAAEIQAPLADTTIRVPTARFDELTDLAGELIVQGRFWVSQAESIRTFAATVRATRHRLLGTMEQLHEAGLGRDSRKPGAPSEPHPDPPGQLGRLAELADDMAIMAESVQASACSMADRAETLVRFSNQIWNSFQSLRIVPIRGLFHRLARVARDAAQVEGRQVDVVMRGEETGVDRAIQDKAFEPLLHVVRNAVGHGIEPPADRARAKKPTSGRVTLEARRAGNAVVISVEDDGRGLDLEAITNKARRLGWLGPDSTPSPEQLHAFIFQPGFSTRSQANAISGRGVGMDVVAREVTKLRGTIDVGSQPARGTRVTLHLPSQLALEPMLIVRVAGQGLAVPASQIETVQPFEPSIPDPGSPTAEGTPIAASPCRRIPTVPFREQAIPVVFARVTLGIGQSVSPSWPKLVVVRTGSQLVGLVVDSIEGTEDLVIKPLGALLAGHPLVSGTSLSLNGELISVLNPTGLERWLKHQESREAAAALASPPQDPCRPFQRERAAALVVDDSISVRRGMARQLASLGLDVQEASDGVEALSRLRGSSFGLVVTDLEMPRLDGFALLSEMKHSAILATIPVVVASTCADAETRRRVLELGAHALLSKPVDPSTLARTVEDALSGVRQ